MQSSSGQELGSNKKKYLFLSFCPKDTLKKFFVQPLNGKAVRVKRLSVTLNIQPNTFSIYNQRTSINRRLASTECFGNRMRFFIMTANITKPTNVSIIFKRDDKCLLVRRLYKASSSLVVRSVVPSSPQKNVFFSNSYVQYYTYI